MKKITTYTTIFIAALLLTFACKKEKPELGISDHDPCGCASEVSADFVIEERAGFPITFVETDTILHTKTVRFSAKEENANYTWLIGSQTFNSQVASRFFNSSWVGSTIPITLIVQKDPNLVCVPNDDGHDTLTKSFYVSEYPVYEWNELNIVHPGIEGVYRVKSHDSNDSIEITVNLRIYGPDIIDVINPDGSGIPCNTNDVRHIQYMAYRELKSERRQENDFCASIGVHIQNRIDGLAILAFETELPTGPNGEWEIKQWEYRGRKIQ